MNRPDRTVGNDAYRGGFLVCNCFVKSLSRFLNTKKTGRRDDSRARSFHFLIVSIQTHRKGIENFCNLSNKSAEQSEIFNEFVVLFSE